MTAGIPVMIHLDRETFLALERIGAKTDLTISQLVTGAASRLAGLVTPTTQGTRYRTVAPETVDQWVVDARAGVSNNAIAERYGVSKSLVSSRLRERGIRRHRKRRS